MHFRSLMQGRRNVVWDPVPGKAFCGAECLWMNLNQQNKLKHIIISHKSNVILRNTVKNGTPNKTQANAGTWAAPMDLASQMVTLVLPVTLGAPSLWAPKFGVLRFLCKH